MKQPSMRVNMATPRVSIPPFNETSGAKGNEFHRVIFRKVYAEGLDPSQWDVMRAGAEEVGLKPDEMQREVESEKYTATVADQVRWAYQIGVTGVPTYVINNRYAIVGVQPYEVFKQVLTEVANQKD
jgi:predicted DsbA family dithiol-disulfide isomerase